MLRDLPILPFHLEATMRGVFEANGLLSFEAGDEEEREPGGGALVLEVNPTSLGSLGGGTVQTFRLPLAAASELRYWSPWWMWGGHLVLTVRSMQALDGMPGAEGHRLVLRIKRGDRELAKNWASLLAVELSEWRLRALR